MRYITNSETTEMRRCMRRWYLSHYRQLKPRSDRIDEAISIGNFVHEPLANWYNDGQDVQATLVYISEKAILEQEDMMEEGLGENAVSMIDQNITTIKDAAAFAKIILEGYLEWLEEEGADSFLSFIRAETELSVVMPVESFSEPVSLLAKLDAQFLDERSNRKVFMDHKTVQNFSDRERWIQKDPQFLFYGLVEYLTSTIIHPGEPEMWTADGILNMLRKVKRTARATPPFFKRKDVRHSLIELQNFFIRITGEINRILQTTEMLDKGIDHHLACPPSPTRDCVWDCKFFTLCDFMDDGSDSEGYVEASYEETNPLERYESVPGLRVV